MDSDTGVSKPMYKEKERDITLYKISIDMLRNLPKEETPRAKRRLINEACQLAIDSLSLLKDVDAHDHDYLFSYLFYYACNNGRKKNVDEYRVFSQLLFVYLFDRSHVMYAQKKGQTDYVDTYFQLLWSKIKSEQLTKVADLMKKSTLVFI